MYRKTWKREMRLRVKKKRKNKKIMKEKEGVGVGVEGERVTKPKREMMSLMGGVCLLIWCE